MTIAKKSRPSRLLPTILAIAVILGLLAGSLPALAATESSAGPIPVTITDSGFEGVPETVPAGLVSMTFLNQGEKDHMALMFKLKPGATLEQLQAAMSNDSPQGEAASLAAPATVKGGAGPLRPGGSETVTAMLDAGDYLLFDFADAGPEGALVQPFQVTGSAENVQEPQADYHVTLHEFVFGLPEKIASGPNTFQVTNLGDQDHEIILVSIGDHTMADVDAALASEEQPAWAVSAGGIGPLAPGATAWMTVDLEPGNYAAVCFVPDPQTGLPHAMLGMATVFSVK